MQFAANAAAACIKIGYWQQALEASTLILDEGADNEEQRKKALFRAGVGARGMGDLDAARAFHKKLLDEYPDDLDKAVKRDIAKQLKGIAEEEKRYKKFAKNIVSKENEESIIEPTKTPAPATPEEIEKMTEIEQKREDYQERKRAQANVSEPTRTKPTEPEVMMSEEDCIDMLNVFAERYGDEKVQEELKQVSNIYAGMYCTQNKICITKIGLIGFVSL